MGEASKASTTNRSRKQIVACLSQFVCLGAELDGESSSSRRAYIGQELSLPMSEGAWRVQGDEKAAPTWSPTTKKHSGP